MALVRPITNHVFAQARFTFRGAPGTLVIFTAIFTVDIDEDKKKKLLGPPFKRETPWR